MFGWNWKKIGKWTAIIAVCASPFVLISTPVLEQIQSWNKQTIETLQEEKENKEELPENWQSRYKFVKTSQKVIADVYRLTFRSSSALEAYLNYRDWFEEEQEEKDSYEESYLVATYRTAQLYESLSEDVPGKYTSYKRRAYCLYQEIQEKYRGDHQYKRSANKATSTRLQKYRTDCWRLEF